MVNVPSDAEVIGRSVDEPEAFGLIYERHAPTVLPAGAQIASAPHAHRTDYRAYEALDLEGDRWRFVQWLQEVPR